MFCVPYWASFLSPRQVWMLLFCSMKRSFPPRRSGGSCTINKLLGYIIVDICGRTRQWVGRDVDSILQCVVKWCVAEMPADYRHSWSARRTDSISDWANFRIEIRKYYSATFTFLLHNQISSEYVLIHVNVLQLYAFYFELIPKTILIFNLQYQL